MTRPGDQLPIPGSGGTVKPVPERVVLQSVRRWLVHRGWDCTRNQAGMGTRPGLSDLIAVKDGRVVFIEAKSSIGRQSPAQVDFQRAIEAHGGLYVLARCIGDLEEAGLG